MDLKAQKDTVFYSVSNGFVESSKDERAHHYYLKKGGRKNGLTKFFYMSHSLYAEVNYKDNNPEGPYTFYFENGQVEEKGQFQEGLRVGTIRKYFKNGQEQSVINHKPVYVEQTHPKIVPANTIFKTLINSWDSLGTQQVLDGNGLYEGPDSESDLLWSKGQYIKGLKSGEWKGYDGEELVFVESYNEGELVQGISYNEDGTTIEYELVSQNAEFPGNIEGWFKYLRKNLKYPKKAKRAGTQGIVHLYFVVDEDGTTRDIEVVSGIGDGCDEEAVRVVNESVWKPAIERGKIIKSRLTMRLVFKLI